METKRVICEFIGGIVFAGIFGACALLIEKFFKTYLVVSGEQILIFLIILGIPTFCFLGFVTVDKLFFGIQLVAKLRFVMALVVSGLLGGVVCALVIDYIPLFHIAKAPLLMFILVAMSLLSYHLFDVASSITE